MLILSLWIDEVVKTKTSDLFNEISYLSTILSESIISQESYFAFHKWREDVIFYNDEMIQSFSNRK
jgi:hypothetical protein